MATKSPPTQRRFTDIWDEIDYLYHKLLYWFYEREDRRRALPFAERLERLLEKTAADRDVILGEECRSLIAELRGDLAGAIRHRQREIRLIRRLHALVRDTPHGDFTLRHFGHGDLSDRLDLLAMLYHDKGDLEKSIKTLIQSRDLCKRHGIDFDGEDLLRQYLRERGRAVTSRR
jgi:tetratricopeptide (TPR) repeat protein